MSAHTPTLIYINAIERTPPQPYLGSKPRRVTHMHEFRVSRLAGDEARLAYPLIRESEPGVALETWLLYAKRIAAPRATRTGIMVATRTGHRFPSGLFGYRCHADLALGAVITADYFVAIDILDPAPVVDAMIQALEQLGRRRACNAVRSVVHRRADVLTDCLRGSGHHMEATNFIKHVQEMAPL